MAVNVGFLNATCDEAEAAYRFLSIRTFYSWGKVLAALGQSAAAAHFVGYGDATVASVRKQGPAWFAGLGVYATADAINAGFATPQEVATMVARQLNDSVTVCGLSPFNTYFVLQALSAAGELDRGHAVLHHCWDGMVQLGATTLWECYRPDWATFLRPYVVGATHLLCGPKQMTLRSLWCVCARALRVLCVQV